jgi:hypothetical protein
LEEGEASNFLIGRSFSTGFGFFDQPSLEFFLFRWSLAQLPGADALACQSSPRSGILHGIVNVVQTCSSSSDGRCRLFTRATPLPTTYGPLD